MMLRQFRSFDLPSQLLMINQFGINFGFYLLMPYLAGYLAGPLGMAAWSIGLILGLRNFAQQGMFIVGGTLADRLGCKPLIVSGCLLRTAGFSLLAVADSLPTLLVASAATGFAGALFNPAVRAYLAAAAGPRRVEAFAMFNVFYQAGILLGPLVGLALLASDFRLTAIVAAAVFGVLTVAQTFALPADVRAPVAETTTIRQDWRQILANRAFLWFATAMIGCYVLTFQVYLAIPLQARSLQPESWLIALVFTITGGVAVLGQLRITRWFAARWGASRSLVIGVTIVASSFVPLAVVPDDRWGSVPAIVALLTCAAVLAVGSVAVFPFEMDTVVSLSRDRLIATHYGFYSTIVGVGILVGNLLTGTAFDAARRIGASELVWVALASIGVVSAVALRRLERTGGLQPRPS